MKLSLLKLSVRRRVLSEFDQGSFTHVLHRGIPGDLLKLAADHLPRPRAVRLLALPAPNTDYSRYNESHQGDDADQQGQCHDFATGRYYHRHLSHRLEFVAITRFRMSRYRNLHTQQTTLSIRRGMDRNMRICIYVYISLCIWIALCFFVTSGTRGIKGINNIISPRLARRRSSAIIITLSLPRIRISTMTAMVTTCRVNSRVSFLRPLGRRSSPRSDLIEGDH